MKEPPATRRALCRVEEILLDQQGNSVVSRPGRRPGAAVVTRLTSGIRRPANASTVQQDACQDIAGGWVAALRGDSVENHPPGARSRSRSRRIRSAPTPANASLIAAENGDPNGAPIRGQKPSQRGTTRPKALVGPEETKRQAQRGIPAFGGRKKWWTGGELNSRHRDFQSRG
jgi:hypothetical protein